MGQARIVNMVAMTRLFFQTGGVVVSVTTSIARLVKTATPLVSAFGPAALAIPAASWKRWVGPGHRGGDPRLSFGVKNSAPIEPTNNVITR